MTVHRRHPKDVRDRQIIVSLDGERLGTLLFGQAVSREVAPGVHRMRAHNTLFWKTHDIVLQPGEHARFVAINRAGWGTFGMLMFLGAAPVYLTFERAPES